MCKCVCFSALYTLAWERQYPKDNEHTYLVLKPRFLNSILHLKEKGILRGRPDLSPTFCTLPTNKYRGNGRIRKLPVVTEGD